MQKLVEDLINPNFYVSSHEDMDKTFENLYSTHYKRVISYIAKRVSSPHEAEDLTSEAFLAAFKAYEHYDEKKASFSTWLFVIVNNKLKNYYRDLKATTILEDYVDLPWEDNMSEMDQAVIICQAREELFKALQKLPEQSREIIIQKYFNGKSSKEIADYMGLSDENVRVIIHRSLKKLRKNISIDI